MMKKAEIVGLNKPLRIVQVDIPATPKKGAIVKVAYSGVCHSDIHQWDDCIDLGNTKIGLSDAIGYKLPVVPGHEISGTVYSIGEEADAAAGLKVGDRVAVYPWIGCSKCGVCTHGKSECCKERQLTIIGVGASSGGHSTHVAVTEVQFVVKLPDSIPLDLACMLPCSGLTTYNAVTSVLDTVEKATLYHGKASVLIIGAGGLGLWSLRLAQALFPPTTEITVADISEEKLKVAKDRGCHDTVFWDRSLSAADLHKATISKGNKGGFDAIMDFVNSQVTAERAFRCLKPYGLHVMVGLFGGAATFPLPMLTLGARQIKGVYVGSLQQFNELIDLVSKNKLDPPPLNYFKLNDVTKAFTLLKEGKINGRGLIKHDDKASL
nr:uncharacterized protein LOC100187292 [Ciona intestinalis]|eukprot:XP_009860926.1 uncharacterized protein LOC100187292 [Ciona intestinalis]